MISKLIEEENKYAGIDRVILPQKTQDERYDLSGASIQIVKPLPKFQKTKYQILKTLFLKEQRGEVGAATWQELKAMLPVEGMGVRLSCWRMNHGYINAGIPRYHHPYIWLTPQKKYRLLNKGRRFVTKVEQEQPDLTNYWYQELINYWSQLEQIKKNRVTGRRNWLINCVKRGIRPQGVSLKELRQIRLEVSR